MTVPNFVISKYVHFQFQERSKSLKTLVWEVQTNDGEDTLLGHVKWYGPWRQYSFFTDSPFTDLVFEKQCLRDIANFCEEQTKAHKSDSYDKKGEP